MGTGCHCNLSYAGFSEGGGLHGDTPRCANISEVSAKADSGCVLPRAISTAAPPSAGTPPEQRSSRSSCSADVLGTLRFQRGPALRGMHDFTEGTGPQQLLLRSPGRQNVVILCFIEQMY